METKRNETELEQLPQENSSDSQTDLESENSEARMPEDGVEGEESGTVSQTETESEEKPRRSRRTRTPKSESDTDEKEVKTTTRRKRANTRTRTAVNVLSIDEHRTVETEADKARNDLLDLIESMKTQKILTGTIQGVEQPEDNPSRSLAVIYHGDFKVIIPAEEAVLPPEDNRGRSQEDVMHYTLTKRLGAEVDYIVKGIDPQSGVAVASRLEAMAAKRKEYYFGTDRDGNNILYEGVCAEARIVSVIRAGIFVDLFGLEIYIPLRELSYQRLLDASSQFQPGQRVLVKILSIDRSDRNHIKASASVKQAGENPYEKALRRFSVGNRYVGTVSMVDTTGVFVALDGGVDCLCSYPKRGRPPRGARVTVRILGLNMESNRIWGAITHIAAPR
ncbi:S1 RNA-binding domain-containing protein [Zongyangia sp. HA2173]|jgi:predicted RNA-binding protein with RPS1 domain|uniref:S1 RNA-binding domain-containing protein n=1 Tax=Zongyangia sp. HA2173 TaxID=3133035 RepID=UPI003162D5CF